MSGGHALAWVSRGRSKNFSGGGGGGGGGPGLESSTKEGVQPLKSGTALQCARMGEGLRSTAPIGSSI